MNRSDSNPEELTSDSKKILVIDDERNIRELIEEILSESGYQVVMAINGQDGIDLFKKERGQFDLVILDIIMPELDGKDCYYKIKEINPRIKVLLTSGYSKSNVKDELLRNGVDAYVRKPFNVDVLLMAVKRMLG